MRLLRLLIAPILWLFEELLGLALVVAIAVPIIAMVTIFPEGRPILFAAALLLYLVAVAAIAIAAARRRARRDGRRQ